MQVVKDKKDLWRIVSMMSLLGFGIIFVIVISIITESGDALGGIGSIFDGDFSRKKKKKKFF